MSLTAVIALGAAACGGSGDNTGTGGKGGGAGGAKGGSSGMAGKGGGGAGGTPAVGGKGGSTGGGGGTATGGSTGGGGGTPAGGAGGAADKCGETVVCVAGATRCSTNAPQTCALDATTGCPYWATTAAQPAVCSANQTCDAASGTCKCNPAAGCGATPVDGTEFCTVAGGATRNKCTMGADGCFTSMPGPCAAGLTCTSAVNTVVPAGTACGCATVLADQTGATVKLLGTGCTAAQATAAARTASKADDAILVCKTDGTCPTWQLSVACGAQQLTGGVDPVTSMPACVCKAPAVANQYYVDPDPAMSNFMTGAPTGAQFPQACRLRTITTAFAQAGVKEVIAQHEQSSNVHFLTDVGTPGSVGCDSPNTCEKFPLNVPAGGHLFTADVGSFNPAHYVVDIDNVGTSKYAVLLGAGSWVEGYTFDASGTNTNGSNGGVGVTPVIVTPATGAAAGIKLNQVLIATRTPAPLAATLPQIGLLVRGQSQVTASYLSVVGGAGTSTGVFVDHATDGTASTTATLVATHLNVNLSGVAGQVGVQVGSNGVANGSGTSAFAASLDAGNTVTVTNDANDAAPLGGTAPHNLKVGGGGTGFLVYNGTVTVNVLDIGSTATTALPGTLTGVDVRSSNTPAASGVNINQGNIVASPANGGFGVKSNGGLVTVNGTHITGIQGGGSAALPWVGVNVASASGTVAGDVTLTGTTALNTVIDTAVLANSNSTSSVGVNVGSSADLTTATTLSRLTIADHVTVGSLTTTGGFVNGVVINNGRFVSTGTDVKVAGNWNDGVRLLGSINPGSLADPLGQGTITGATITKNRRLGVYVNDTVPATLANVTVSENGTPLTGALVGTAVGGGIDVVQSQASAQAGYLFKLTGSKIQANKGCGLALTGGNSLIGAGTKRVCGVATTEGGKVSGDVENNTISGNLYVGLYITEANPAGNDVTEVILQSNTVTGNLTQATSILDAVEPIAGGIYFASSNADTGPGTADIACGPGVGCTRVRAEKFLGNVVSCNGRHELGYGIPQRINVATATAWDIGSASGSVDMALACSAAAFPNTITGYGGAATGLDLGLAVTSLAIHVNALGVKWMNAVPAAGVDYSAFLGVAPTGNGDASAPGSVTAPAKGFVFCPAVPATCTAD